MALVSGIFALFLAFVLQIGLGAVIPKTAAGNTLAHFVTYPAGYFVAGFLYGRQQARGTTVQTSVAVLPAVVFILALMASTERFPVVAVTLRVAFGLGSVFVAFLVASHLGWQSRGQRPLGPSSN